MANLALQMRLGIRRGWCVKMFNDLRLYTPSLIHCMFVFSLLRVKALRLRLWIVGYYLFFSFRRLVIYAFFWSLPLSCRVFKTTGSSCRLRVRRRRSYRRYPRSIRLRLRLIPNRFSWTRTQRVLCGLRSKKCGERSVLFSTLWDFAADLLQVFCLRLKYTYLKNNFGSNAGQRFINYNEIVGIPRGFRK